MKVEQRPAADDELLKRIFLTTRSVTNPQVQADFCLVNPLAKDGEPLEEFIYDRFGGRYIATLADSEIAQKHTRLLEARVAVLSAMFTPEQLLMFQVPSGARPVGGYVNSIRRNHFAYGSIFTSIGNILGQLEGGVGQTLTATPDYPLLRQFAAAADDETSSGGKVFLLPPYNLADVSREDVLASIGQELVGTHTVLPVQADYLVERLNDGWLQSQG